MRPCQINLTVFSLYLNIYFEVSIIIPKFVYVLRFIQYNTKIVKMVNKGRQLNVGGGYRDINSYKKTTVTAFLAAYPFFYTLETYNEC